MASEASPLGEFNAKRLNEVAREVRLLEAESALTVAATRKGNLALQPKLSFKNFAVTKAQVAVSPDCSYRLLTQAIEGAKKSITAYVYNIGAPYILELLKKKLKEGVTLRVMVDPNDPNDSKSQEFEHLKKLGKFDLQLSPSSAARPVFTVCHQKFVVVDHVTTVVESANWATSSIPPATKVGQYVPGNREWLIRVDDKDLAAWFEDLFDKDWNIPPTAGLAAAAASPVVPAILEDASSFVPLEQLFDIVAATKAVNVLPVISPVNYLTKIGELLRSAKSRIWLQQQYITAGDGVNDLLQIVHDKAKTCDVRIIVSPKYASSWYASVNTLKAAGLYGKLRAQNLQHVIHCHNKGVLVDDEHVVVSSTNWSENSITRAREAGLLVRSRELTDYYAGVFDLDWKDGTAPTRVSARTVAVAATEMF
jgi:phosphatidylserine/phosphatidylglycerophosphate/cardiolipin synthase-like enzyme